MYLEHYYLKLQDLFSASLGVIQQSVRKFTTSSFQCLMPYRYRLAEWQNLVNFYNAVKLHEGLNNSASYEIFINLPVNTSMISYRYPHHRMENHS